jgi:hypothetical protein
MSKLKFFFRILEIKINLDGVIVIIFVTDGGFKKARVLIFVTLV